MLEREHYDEAIQLLRGLTDMQIGDPNVMKEWEGLLDYLRIMIPDGRMPDAAEEDDLSEEELLESHVTTRSADNGVYAERLVRTFEERNQLERQIAALDQLRYIRHPRIGATVRRWLAEHTLPPGVQFKTLQMLKAVGESGSVALTKHGHTYLVDIGDTPSSFDQFPSALCAVSDRIQSVAARVDPELSLFAEETWREYLAYVYGTPAYTKLAAIDEDGIDVWSAALHISLLKTVYGVADAGEVRESYGITEELKPQWQLACDSMREFMTAGWPASPS